MASPHLVLRDAVATDVDALTDLFLAARRTAMPYLPALHTDAQTRWWLAEIVLRDCRVRVAEADGQVAGFAAIADGWLHHLYIAPACQGTGVGSALLDDAKGIAAGGLQLYAFQRNERALCFYRRRGFVEEAYGDGSGNEEHEPDVRMRWVATSCTS
ncbi:GNAT family N-acetyltransferase [Vineibacter terrae]|uniref:GNAT family N-acetyltransferase n=1 Tax=Vineibacter terrae TaxID=2586908 RepID=UPI002E32AB14|nr:GNAT family N-acetyltransferase [Vineibacter terrae]HEX2891660.1 GNAT family N-acetyltransferase [Vineibacter terrae]